MFIWAKKDKLFFRENFSKKYVQKCKTNKQISNKNEQR